LSKGGVHKVKFLDFFSGIGGFRLGMEMAGHECVGHCEIDKYADKSYRAMHNVREDEWYASDIREVRATDIPRADIWCFGFPCQDISVAGKQVGFDGERSSLFFTVTNLIRWTKKDNRPKYLIAENVKNFFSVNGGYDFLKAIIEMDEIGYDCEWQLLNSKNFGVPQNRERIFLIGHLRGTSTREVFPIAGSNGETLKQVIGGKQANRVYDPSSVSCALASQGGGQGAKTGLYFVDLTKGNPVITENARCLKARYTAGVTNRNGDNSGVLEIKAVLTPDRAEKRQNGRQFKEVGEPMFTLTAQDKHGVTIYQRPRGNNNGGLKEIAPTITKNSYEHNNHLIQGTKIRRLTPKECFRLQGWPDEYFERAAAVNSDTQLYKQAGNGVTVKVIYELAKRL